MKLKDFTEYPMIEALKKAFSHTDAVLLKLPKNIDKKSIIEDISEMYF